MKFKEYENSMSELLAEWKKLEHHKNHCFVNDGIIDINKWNKSNKILVILKEAYGSGKKEKEWNYSNLITTDAEWVMNKPMYKMLCYWLYAISNTTLDYYSVELTNDMLEIGYDILCSSAVINLKKSNGISISRNSDLIEYIKKDKKFIKKQIEIINPNIILCGYTGDMLFQYVFEDDSYIEKYKSEYIIEYNGKPYINYYHPARKLGVDNEKKYTSILAKDYKKYLKNRNA
jgi:hypothetical protein